MDSSRSTAREMSSPEAGKGFMETNTKHGSEETNLDNASTARVKRVLVDISEVESQDLIAMAKGRDT